MPVPGDLRVVANNILDNIGTTTSQMGYFIAFDLVDASFNNLGAIHPLSASSVNINTVSSIFRTISGVSLTNNDMAEIDPFNYRLRPKMVLGDGSEWPLGIFTFSDQVNLIHDGVYPVNLTLSDLSGELDQQSITTISFPAGASVLNSIVYMLDKNRINTRVIPLGDSTPIAEPGVTWPAGTSQLTIIQELCELGGFLPGYFDNSGTFIIRRPMPHVDADFVYSSTGGKVVAGSIKEASNLLGAPNAYVVIDTAPKEGPISAVAYVNAQLPWSKENRGGRLYPDVLRTQGLTSAEQAQQMANARAQASGVGFNSVEFSTIPDPRHDLFVNVEWDGFVYREVSSTFSLAFGVAQQHKIIRGGFGAS